MRPALLILGGWLLGLATSSLLETAVSDHLSYSRACLPGDECTLLIKPAGEPWLNITCDLGPPTRCRDE